MLDGLFDRRDSRVQNNRHLGPRMSAVVSSAEYRPLIGKSTLTDANLLQIRGTQGHTLAVALACSASFSVRRKPMPKWSIRLPVRARRLDPFKNPPAGTERWSERPRTSSSRSCRFGAGRTPFCHIVVHLMLMGAPEKASDFRYLEMSCPIWCAIRSEMPSKVKKLEFSTS